MRHKRSFAASLLLLGAGMAGCSSPAPTAAAIGARTSTVAVSTREKSATKTVAYNGLSIAVPTGWPVIDGAHAPLCGSPFSLKAQVFVGSTITSASCPAVVGHGEPGDGVWLTSDRQAPPGAIAFMTATGLPMLAGPQGRSLIAVYWIHGVTLQLGQGSNPSISNAILSSIRLTPGAANTAVAGYCPRDPIPVVPTPQRLTSALSLNLGNIDLRPPLASDQPKIAGAQIWKAYGSAEPWSTSQLLLARYSSKFPATLSPSGGTKPINSGELAWIVYQQPKSTSLGDCGIYGLSAYDAKTGKPLAETGYEPGP